MQRLVCTTNQYQRQLQTCLKCTHPHHDLASRVSSSHVFREGREPREKPMGRRPAALLSSRYFEREKKTRWSLRPERANEIGMRMMSCCVAGERERREGERCCGVQWSGQRRGRKAGHPRELTPVCQSLLQQCYGAHFVKLFLDSVNSTSVVNMRQQALTS